MFLYRQTACEIYFQDANKVPWNQGMFVHRPYRMTVRGLAAVVWLALSSGTDNSWEIVIMCEVNNFSLLQRVNIALLYDICNNMIILIQNTQVTWALFLIYLSDC